MFNFDSIPSIIINNPVNNSIIKSNTAIDLSITDDNELANVTVSWDNDLPTLLAPPYTLFTKSGDGKHILVIKATDTNGNINITNLMLTVDDLKPGIGLKEKQNNTEIDSNTVIELTITDENGLDAVLVEWDSLGNTTITSSLKTSSPSTSGLHYLKVYASDKAGNWALTIYIFTVRSSSNESTPFLEFSSLFTFLTITVYLRKRTKKT